jgi:hypothetical protein
MSRRNFTLLIIILSLFIFGLFGYFYFTRTNINTNNGEATDLNFLSRINPFNSKSPSGGPTGQNTEPGDTDNTEVPPVEDAKLKQISSMPVAGYTIFQKEVYKEVPPAAEGEVLDPKAKPKAPQTEFVPMVRYVARADGNIYESFLNKLGEIKFSNTEIPKIYEASFALGGESVLMRYLKADETTIETFLGILPKEILGQDPKGDVEVKGSFLPEDITSMALSLDNKKLFYLFNVGENAIGVNFDIANNKKTQVISTPFTEWLTQYPNLNMVTLTTKPSALASGYMYKLDLANKNLNKILADIKGLTTLTSPSGKTVLYGDSNLSLNLYNIDTREVRALGLSTLPEKCLWANGGLTIYCAVPVSPSGGLYPDSWYKGEISFNDQLWKVDTLTGVTTLVAELPQNFDVVNLSLDQNEGFLIFINKNNSSLWELGLK